VRDNFLLLEIIEGAVAGLLAFPIATAFGSNVGITFVTVLVVALAPGFILCPFATDFSSGSTYSPNPAARALHVTENIRLCLCVWALSTMLMRPVGWILGLDAQPFAIFILVAGGLLCFVAEFAPAMFHRLLRQRDGDPK
jgi:MFS superfamily sulfate permease-like transporter